MDDLDVMLTRLAHAPVPVALETIESRVMARIADRPAARAGHGIGAFGVAMALIMGVVGGGGAPAPAYAVPLSPLGPDAPLAPSTLLGDP